MLYHITPCTPLLRAIYSCTPLLNLLSLHYTLPYFPNQNLFTPERKKGVLTLLLILNFGRNHYRPTPLIIMSYRKNLCFFVILVFFILTTYILYTTYRWFKMLNKTLIFNYSFCWFTILILIQEHLLIFVATIYITNQPKNTQFLAQWN